MRRPSTGVRQATVRSFMHLRDATRRALTHTHTRSPRPHRRPTGGSSASPTCIRRARTHRGAAYNRLRTHAHVTCSDLGTSDVCASSRKYGGGGANPDALRLCWVGRFVVLGEGPHTVLRDEDRAGVAAVGDVDGVISQDDGRGRRPARRATLLPAELLVYLHTHTPPRLTGGGRSLGRSSCRVAAARLSCSAGRESSTVDGRQCRVSGGTGSQRLQWLRFWLRTGQHSDEGVAVCQVHNVDDSGVFSCRNSIACSTLYIWTVFVRTHSYVTCIQACVRALFCDAHRTPTASRHAQRTRGGVCWPRNATPSPVTSQAANGQRQRLMQGRGGVPRRGKQHGWCGWCGLQCE